MRAGASLNARERGGFTPLHVSAWNGHGEVVEILIRAGASVNAVNSDGLSPLHMSASNGHREFVAVLVKAGASVRKRTNVGFMASYYAKYKSDLYFYLKQTEKQEKRNNSPFRKISRKIADAFGHSSSRGILASGETVTLTDFSIKPPWAQFTDVDSCNTGKYGDVNLYCIEQVIEFLY